MSMTELERHLLNCLEELQREFILSQKNQDKHLAELEARQEEQEETMDQLKDLFKKLDPLLHQLNSVLRQI